MKKEGDKQIRALLKSGQFVHFFVEPSSVDTLSQAGFIAASDEFNTIWVNPKEISIFEVLDDRKQEEVQPSTSDPATV